MTERLAELLGREVEELQETAATEPQDMAATVPDAAENTKTFSDRRQSSPEASVHLAEEEQPAPTRTGYRKSSKGLGSNGGAGSISQATDTALEQLRSAQEEIEASLRSRVQDYERALEATMSGHERGGAASEKTAEEAAQQFRSEAREWFDEARRELREQLEMSRASIDEQLRAHHAELLQAAQQKIESMTRASVEADAHASRQTSQEQVERWLKEQGEISRRQTEAGTQNLAKATEEALGRLRGVQEKIEATFQAQVEEYRRTVQKATADLEQKGISQAQFQNAAEELQRITGQILERTGKKIEERAEEAMSRISEKLTAAEQSLGAAARAAMQGAIEEQQQRVADIWQDRTRTAMEAVSLAGEQSRTQIEEARKAAEREFQNAAREQSRRLVEQVSTELKSSEFRDQALGDLRKQMEQGARELLARSTSELGKQSELAISGLTSTLDKTTEKFLSQVQQRVEMAGPAWIEAAGQAVQQQYQARISQWLEEQTGAARRQAADAARSVEQATEQAATRLQTISRETESTLQSRLQEQQQRWLDSALEEARKSGFERKVVEQALAELEKNTGRFVEQSTRHLTEQAAAARDTIAKEMDGAARKLLEGVEASLENISWQHRGRLAQWWEERAQTARREAETASQSIAQAAQQAASQLRTAQNEIEAEMKNRARDHQMRLLDSAMEEMRSSGAIERTVSEASLALRTNANEVLTRTTEQLRDHVETARMGIENQSLAARRTLSEELARKVEQAQTSVEAAGKAVTEDYRRQLSVWWEERAQFSQRESEEAVHRISRSAKQASEQLQTIQKQMTTELQSGMENYRKGLREAAADELRRQGFQKDMLDLIAGELTKTAQGLTEQSTRELQRHVDKTLSGLDEKVQSSRQALLDDSQKKLADMVRTSMDTATSRFHELLSKNAQELEHEQEEWLQRKREAVWLEINKHAPASAQGRFSGSDSSQTIRQKAASAGILGRLLMATMVVALAAGLTAAFVKLAPQPVTVMQLKSDPPAGYVYENPSWGAQQRAHELQFAHAYWMIAVNDLQHKYAYGTPLPATPPPDFRVDQGGLREDPATRMRYWDELRQVWTSPEDWQKTTSGGSQLVSDFQWLQEKIMQPQGQAKAAPGQ